MTAVPCVDWRLAAATGRLLVPAGPDVARAEVAAMVAELRACADRATAAVAAASGLRTPMDAEVLVVDRDSWLGAATSMSAAMMGAIGQQPPATLGERVGARLAGAQLGAALAFVATRILGQFDPYSPVRRLLLVVPNIVAAERAMGGEPQSFRQWGFRQWVCLHEETHRFQFGAAPWLREHLLGLMAGVFDDDRRTAAIDEITAVMSLLEGHADVIMDVAGAGLVPQVARLRAAIEARRDATGSEFIELVFRLLGLRAKREQYRHGATFCRAVIDRVGVAGLNLAFRAPELLPSPAELHRPEDWLRRVPERVG